MIEEMEIGILLNIEGDALGKLGVIRQRMLKTDAIAKQLTSSFKALDEVLDTQAASWDALQDVMGENALAIRAVTRASGGLGASSARTTGKLDAMAASAAALNANLRESDAAMTSLSGARRFAGIGGVQQAPMPEVAPMPHRETREHGGYFGNVAEKGHSIWDMIGPAIALDLGGHGIADILRPGMTNVTIQQQMQIQGLSTSVMKGAMAAVNNATAKVPTLSLNEGMAMWKELYMAFPKVSDVNTYLATVAKADAVIRAAVPGGAEIAPGVLSYDLSKAQELRGTTSDPVKFEHQMMRMVQGIEASGGKLTPGSYLQMFKYAHQALQGLSNNFLYTIAPSYMQDVMTKNGGGASTVGTALSSFYGNVIAGKVNKAQYIMLKQLGMIKPGSQLIMAGGNDQFSKGGFIDRGLASSNPYLWVQEVLLPKLRAHGYVTEKAILTEITKLFPNRTVSGMFGYFATQQARYDADQIKIEKAMPYAKAYTELLNKNPTMAKAYVEAQISSTLTQLSKGVIPELVYAADHLAAFTKDVGNFFKAHQTVAKGLMYGAGGIMALIAGRLAFGLGAYAFEPLIKLAPYIGRLALGFGDLIPYVGDAGMALLPLAPEILLTTAAFGAAAAAGWELGKGLHDLAEKLGWASRDASAKELQMDPFHTAQGKQAWHQAQALVHKSPIHTNIVPPPRGTAARDQLDAVHAALPFVQVHTHINLDGQHVADVVTQHQINAAGARTGPSQYAPSGTMPYPQNPVPTGG